MDNFLIIRLSSLGDIIHTLPAYSALRKTYPKGKISWVVEDKGKEILDLVPGIDKIVVTGTEGWRIGTRKFWKDISRLKKDIKNKDQIALDFQGLIKSGFIVSLSGAKKKIGFHRKNLRESLAAWFYTDQLEEIPETIHVIDKNLKLLSLIGIQGTEYDFPLVLPKDLIRSVQKKLLKIGYTENKKLVVLNVGAAWKTKRWFPENWVELITQLKQDNLYMLILWGNEQEKALAEEVHEKTGVPVAPDLSLKEVLALVKGSSLLISGDTFALQVACAFFRPVVGLFGPTNPKRNGPFRPQDKVAFHEMECSYCYKRSCSSLECLKQITPKEVADLSIPLLEENA